jgi:hypothetical protein
MPSSELGIALSFADVGEVSFAFAGGTVLRNEANFGDPD